LLAATRSGTGLPVGQLEIKGYATVDGEVTQLATMTGDAPLLARAVTGTGGVYFCTASTSTDQSTFAANGIVLYVVVQRAIEQGLSALGQTSQREAGTIVEPTDAWQQVAGATDILSSEYAYQSGIYRVGDGDGSQWYAVNRSLREDQRDTIEDARLETLFAGLDFSRVDDQAGSLSGIVREIWRVFLVMMIAAMLLEALLCIPRRAAARRSQVRDGFASASSENAGGRAA